MHRKYIFCMLIMIIFVTGCSANYNLKIANNSFKEKIDMIIPKSAIPTLTEYEIKNNIELDDQVTPFIENDTPSLNTNDKFYKKKVSEYDDYYDIKMSYTYSEQEFEQSNSINSCFEYPELDFSDNYYLNLQGRFNCLYGDSVDIKIETNSKAIYNNADEVSGNLFSGYLYTWHVNQSNFDYVDIKLEVSKGLPIKQILFYVGIALVIIIVTTILYKGLYLKNKKANEI